MSKIHSVVKYGVDKFEGVETVKDTSSKKLQERLLQDDDKLGNLFDNSAGWKPCFSQLLVEVIDANLVDNKSQGGIFIVEAKDKLPYITCRVIASGPKAGVDSFYDRDVAFEDFQPGDEILVFEKHVSFFMQDKLGHSDFYVPGRSYLATVPDKYVILKRKATEIQ